MPDVIYIQFAESASAHGGEHIRKWSREPFDGGEAFTPDREYICKCGLRVEPHRCRDTQGQF